MIHPPAWKLQMRADHIPSVAEQEDHPRPREDGREQPGRLRAGRLLDEDQRVGYLGCGLPRLRPQTHEDKSAKVRTPGVIMGTREEVRRLVRPPVRQDRNGAVELGGEAGKKLGLERGEVVPDTGLVDLDRRAKAEGQVDKPRASGAPSRAPRRAGIRAGPARRAAALHGREGSAVRIVGTCER